MSWHLNIWSLILFKDRPFLLLFQSHLIRTHQSVIKSALIVIKRILRHISQQWLLHLVHVLRMFTPSRYQLPSHTTTCRCCCCNFRHSLITIIIISFESYGLTLRLPPFLEWSYSSPLLLHLCRILLSLSLLDDPSFRLLSFELWSIILLHQ